jgi:hypothetical protein
VKIWDGCSPIHPDFEQAFDLTRNSKSNITMLDHGLTRFKEGSPPSGQPLQLLCEDDKGTYVLPFLCEFRGGGWHNAKGKTSGNVIAAKVIGWRLPPD